MAMTERKTNHIITFARLRFGSEVIWAQILDRIDGGFRVKIDNETFDPGSPRFGEEIDVKDADVLEMTSGAPVLRLVK